jgi:hypothetical protein
MGWRVSLEDENGLEVSILDDELRIGYSQFNSEDFTLLKYIDPYGNTIFNRFQIDDLVLDLIKLKETYHYPILDKIIDLAAKCKSKIHTYIVFMGD